MAKTYTHNSIWGHKWVEILFQTPLYCEEPSILIASDGADTVPCGMNSIEAARHSYGMAEIDYPLPSGGCPHRLYLFYRVELISQCLSRPIWRMPTGSRIFVPALHGSQFTFRLGETLNKYRHIVKHKNIFLDSHEITDLLRWVIEILFQFLIVEFLLLPLK